MSNINIVLYLFLVHSTQTFHKTAIRNLLQRGGTFKIVPKATMPRSFRIERKTVSIVQFRFRRWTDWSERMVQSIPFFTIEIIVVELQLATMFVQILVEFLAVTWTYIWTRWEWREVNSWRCFLRTGTRRGIKCITVWISIEQAQLFCETYESRHRLKIVLKIRQEKKNNNVMKICNKYLILRIIGATMFGPTNDR